MTSDGLPIKHFLSAGYLWSALETVSPYNMENAKFVIDDICNDDYGLILVPKVVSYDAALLNYFFRGTLEISLPDDGVYAVADPQSPDGFTKIRLKVKNTTGNNELMTDGTIRAVIRYQLAQTDPFQNHPVEISQETSYAISSSINLASLSTGSVQDITFDLPPNSLPFRATNVYAQVVFQGQLGNEVGTVAVGYKDLSEPTPVDIINTMDTVCLYNTLYAAGSDAALQAVDPQGDRISTYEDVYQHGMRDATSSSNPALP